VSAASGVDTWTISDFERGLTASLGKHAAAVERALAAFGIRFDVDGSISLATPPAPPLLEAGAPYRWITAQDLSSWGGTRDGQEGLPRELGHAIATAAIPEAQKDELLERALVETESKLEEFSYGMLFALRQVRGDGWLLGRFRTGVENAEDPGRLVRLALALPANREHWDVVASAGTETENAYWSGIDDHAIPETSDPVFVIDKLLSADRGGAALTWVGAHPRISVPSSLVVAILRHASTTNADKLAGGPVCTSITSWQCSRGWMTILRLPSRKSPASNGRITVCLNIPTAPRSDCKVLSLPIPVSSCICLVVFIFRRVVPMLQKPSLRKEKEM
jgi:hypothetical protein